MSEARSLVDYPGLLATVHPLLRPLQDLLRQEASAQGLVTNKIEVSELVDPEEGDQRVVVRQWVQAPPQRALAYWDDLEILVQVWMDSLPTGLRQLADIITISVRWTAALGGGEKYGLINYATSKVDYLIAASGR